MQLVWIFINFLEREDKGQERLSLEKKEKLHFTESSGQSVTEGPLPYVFSFSPWAQAQEGGIVTTLQIWKAVPMQS